MGKNLYSDLKQEKSLDLRSRIKNIVLQIVEGLVYMKKLEIIHCDLKPENILYTDPLKMDIKVIDFGSGCFFKEKGFSYVQSRFYRAPEIVLGLPYDCEVDMWSLGCIVQELYSGVPIFPGIDENELLEFQVLLCGNPASYMIEQGKKKEKFFNKNNGNKIIRSLKSRLINFNKNSTSLARVLFKHKFPENTDSLADAE